MKKNFEKTIFTKKQFLKNAPLLTGFLFLFLFLLGSVLRGLAYQNQERALQQRMQSLYQKNFFTLLTHLENLENTLGKLQICEDTQKSRELLGQVQSLSLNAQGCLEDLPLTSEAVENTYRFFNQMQDYASVYNHLIFTVPVPKKELTAMQTRCDQLWEELNQVRTQSAQQLSQLFPLEKSKADLPLADKMALNYPTLLYDGPFSDASRLPPKGIKGAEITQAEACTLASQFVGGEIGWAQPANELKGDLPCYGVELYKIKEGVMTLYLTKKGGQVLLWSSEHTPSQTEGQTLLSQESCYDIAYTFLKDRGYENLTSNYYEMSDCIATLHFVPMQEEVLLYPDLIKVQVNRISGKVMGLESGNYLRNHVKRDFASMLKTQLEKLPAQEGKNSHYEENVKNARISTQEALEKADRLTQTCIRLCVIPHNREEILCYEINGLYQGETYLCYVDACVGTLVNVYRLKQSEDSLLAQ